MADTKASAFTLNGAPVRTDRVVIIDDPAGTPANNIVTINDIGFLLADPTSDDGDSLGTASVRWSDLFLAEGGVINWDNGDFTITQAGNDLTFAGGTVVMPAAAAAEPGLQLTSGTLQTTPEVGSIEMDANCIYMTTDAGNRGYNNARHLIRQDSTYTLANSAAAQQLFNAATNGRITLETGAYMFEMLVSITAMSATSGNATFSIDGGSATLGSILWFGTGRDAAADAATGTLSGSYSRDSTLVTAPLLTAATTTELFVFAKGTYEVTGAGTVQPRITLQTAIGTAVVAAGSYFECWRVGSTSATTVGQWD